MKKAVALRYAGNSDETNLPEATVDEQKAITVLRDIALQTQKQIVEIASIQACLIPMLCALISLHPDKVSLRDAFGQFWIKSGLTNHSVEELLRGADPTMKTLMMFSEALGMTLP